MGLKDWKEAKANKKIVKEENLINKANAQKIAKTGVVQSKEDRDRLLRASSLSIADFFKDIGVDEKTGLNDETVEANREKYGANTVTKIKSNGVFHRLFKAFTSPFSLILLVVAIISAIVAWLPGGTAEDKATWWVTPLIIIIMVLLSGTVSFVEETKSLRSAASLKSMTENTSTVIRNGKVIELPNDQLVVGDIVRIGAGDMLPADVRVVAAKDLFVSQSALTGEQQPVEKNTNSYNGNLAKANPFDVSSLAFEGSNVVSGRGEVCIVNVGNKTVFGALREKVVEKKGKTAFEKGVDSVAKMLMSFLVVMVPLIFIIDGFGIHITSEGLVISGYNDYKQWIQALMFAMSVAVGLTPALLPMQVAANLAKGAVKMSGKKVIVKDINSIQNFGAMDVLCTDKTGTLTENSSTLAEYFNFDGVSSPRVLRLAFLNSYFQTGIKSVIDKSIVAYAESDRSFYESLTEGLVKLDEIPFDFDRKRLTVLLKDHTGAKFMVVKGATDSMIKTLGFIKTTQGKRPITDDDIAKIKLTADKESLKGRRTILMATKDTDKDTITVSDESDLVFAGYICFEDTPKASAKEALDGLRNFGVTVKVLTGDNEPAARAVCRATGFDDIKVLSGDEIREMSDDELTKKVEECNLFVKLSPDDKSRIVTSLQRNKHTVGFMGDGINDAAALHAADVGISFKDATDIAKESADIIMLENDLNVLRDGIIEGRKSYVNMMKYLKGQTSSNFGNMISQMIGAIWIPFIPMQALQIILLDIITDVSCSMIPFDSVDERNIMQPLDFSVKQIRSFMFAFGPLSSCIDMITFAFLMYFISPLMVANMNSTGDTINWAFQSGMFNWNWAETSDEYITFMMTFQTGFFLESLITQNVVYAFLRTDRIPLIQSWPNVTLSLGIVVSCLLGFFVVYVPNVNATFDMVSINPIFLVILFGQVLLYGLLTQPVKYFYKKHYGRLL